MRPLRILPLALAAACGGGVGSHEDAADATLDAMKEYASILESVKDKGSAEAARPKIEALSKRLDELVKRVEKLGEPKGDDARKAEEKMRAGIEGISARMEANMGRLDASPDVGAVILEPAMAVSGKLMALRGMLGG
jgi:hypothetical protein